MTTRENGRLGPWAIVASMILAVAAMGTFCNARRVVKVEEMLAELRQGDTRQAYARCTEEDFRSKVTLERFETVLSDIPFQKATRIEVEFRKYFADRSAIADATLTTPDGPVHLTFYIYRPVLGNDFLVGQILAGDLRLFAEELGDW